MCRRGWVGCGSVVLGIVGVVEWWVWLVAWWCGRGLAISRSGAKLVCAFGLLVLVLMEVVREVG